MKEKWTVEKSAVLRAARLVEMLGEPMARVMGC